MSDITIRRVPHGSAAYEAMVALRQAVLRDPLGLRFTPSELEAEANQIHLAAYGGDGLAGTVLVVLMPDGTAKLRQMAVAGHWQGRGVGQALLAAAEREVAEAGCPAIALHARLSAAGFYEHNGYEQAGDVFDEVTLPHIRMQKALR